VHFRKRSSKTFCVCYFDILGNSIIGFQLSESRILGVTATSHKKNPKRPAPTTAYPPIANLFTSNIIAPAVDVTCAGADLDALPVVAIVIADVVAVPVVVAAPPLIGKFVGTVTLIPNAAQICTEIVSNS
jgi:hypothetical protein